MCEDINSYLRVYVKAEAYLGICFGGGRGRANHYDKIVDLLRFYTKLMFLSLGYISKENLQNLIFKNICSIINNTFENYSTQILFLKILNLLLK